MIYKERKKYFKISRVRQDDVIVTENEFIAIKEAVDQGKKAIVCTNAIIFISSIQGMELDKELMKKIDGSLEIFGYFDDKWWMSSGSDSMYNILENKKKLTDGTKQIGA